MPLQNRVDPYGALFRTTARGTMLGNRGGAIHNEHKEIVRPFKSRQWIACLLEFKGRHRKVMSPGLYTELFFLDEATAFAAGHRPCAECRRAHFNSFKEAWNRAHGRPAEAILRAAAIDEELHRARIYKSDKRTYEADIDELPSGTFIELQQAPFIVWDDQIAEWTAEGYATKRSRPTNETVKVLTPKPIVDCFLGGYLTTTHHTLNDRSPRGVN